MIRISCKDKQVTLSLDTYLPALGQCTYTFFWECGQEDYADLLSQNFQTSLNNRIKDIRRSEYEKGWKDAKSKRRKEDWFAGSL
jgi:hypothetical protein